MARRKEGKSLSDYVTSKPQITPLLDVNPETRDFLRNVIDLSTQTIRYFEKTYHPEWIMGYYDKNLYMGERFLKLLRTNMYRRSNDCFPLTASAHEVFVSNAFNQEDNIIVRPVEKMDEDKARIGEKVNKWIFGISNIKETLQMMVDEAALIGNSFCRLSVKKYREEIQYLKEGKVKTDVRDYCNPDLTYVSPFSIFREPGARSFKSSTYWIYRRIMRIDEAVSFYNKIFPGGIDISQDEKDVIQYHGTHASTKDHERVKDISYHYHNMKTCWLDEIKNKDISDFTDHDFSLSENDIYQIDRDSNNNIEVIEYRERDKCAILFNGIGVYAGPSIYPFDDCPFEHLGFETTPGFAVAKGIAQKNRPFQVAINEFHNSYADGLKITANPMFKMPRTQKGGKTFDYVARGVVDTMALQDIERVDIIDFNTLSQLQNAKSQTQAESDRALGLNSYTAGGEGTTERSATGTTARQQVTQVKLIPFRKNINRLLTSASEKFMIMARNDFTDKFIIKVIGEDDRVLFEEIKIEDLINKFDLQYQYSNLAGEEVRRLQNIELLKTILPANMDPMRNRPVADISVLMKEILNNSGLLNKNIIPSDEKRLQIAKDQIEFTNSMQELMPQQPQQPHSLGQMDPNAAEQATETLNQIQMSPGAPDATAEITQQAQKPVSNVGRERLYLSEGDVLSQANRTV